MVAENDRSQSEPTDGPTSGWMQPSVVEVVVVIVAKNVFVVVAVVVVVVRSVISVA